MSQLLTTQRLLQLASFNPQLKNTWYLIAAATFSVCNQPQEIPRLYHYAMQLNGLQDKDGSIAKRTIDMLQSESHSSQRNLNEVYSDVTQYQKELTKKFREALLKSSALAGLPKAINSLHYLNEATPEKLLASDPNYKVDIHGQDLFKGTERDPKEAKADTLKRGLDHWTHIYNKVTEKVINNLNSSYPDLWFYTLCHVYGPLLSFDDILDAKETSLVIIACLVPQDVNPQLWGHMKGAVNVGYDKEVINTARNMSILVAQWCGVTWRSDIVKL